jgi:acyl dehydratase
MNAPSKVKKGKPENYYFEDYVVGDVYEFGKIDVEESEVISFGKRFDPQPMHVDPEVAKQSMFGGLIASGWHTAALMMRMVADNYFSHSTSLGGLGVDELRWLKPVRPGYQLSLRVTVVKTHRSTSKPDRGLVHSLVEVMNQHGEMVMKLTAMNLIRCRSVEKKV